MENPDPLMEHPDQLKTPAPAGQRGYGDLDDFLWDAASWDPAAEQVLLDVCHHGTREELVAAARRLLDERLLTEPAMVDRLIWLLTEAGALDPGHLAAAAGEPGSTQPGAPGDPPGPAIPMTGRETESVWGQREATHRRDGLSIVCITGPAGIGKTRLARAIVEAIGGPQPSRRLEVSLSSAAPGNQDHQLATAPHAALLDLLIQAGMGASDVPATLEGRRACYLEMLAGQRAVLLIDGAIDESQVLPLLPPTRGSVVVTSRSALTGLSDWDARYISLEPLNRAGSRQLAQHAFEALEAEAPDAVIAAICEWCAGVPGSIILVCRWMAATAAAEGLALETLTERIRAAHAEGARATAIFGLLQADQQAVVRALGWLQLPVADLTTVCLATGLSQDRAQAALDQLTRMGLTSSAAPTWTMMPLAASWARVPGWGQVTDAEAEPILGPVLDLYRLRAENLRDVLTASPPGSLPVLRAWAEERWQAGQAGRSAILRAAAGSPCPALGRRLAAVVMDVAAYAEEGETGWHETEQSIGPVLRIANDAGDRQLEERALEWLRSADRRRGVPGPGISGPGTPSVDPAGIPAPSGLTWLGSIATSGLSAPPALLFGAGAYRA
jgi:hypothetical protein